MFCFFNLPLSGQFAVSVLVFVIISLMSGVINCIAPVRGSKLANYIFRFAAGGAAGSFLSMHFITNGSGDIKSIIIDVVCGLWVAIISLWLLKIDDKKKNMILAIATVFCMAKSTEYDLFWGYSYATMSKRILMAICFLIVICLTKIVSEKGSYAANIMTGTMVIAANSAYILRNPGIGYLIAAAFLFTCLSFHANVLSSEEANKIIKSVINKKNLEKIKGLYLITKDMVLSHEK